MSKQPEKERITVSVPVKSSNIFRRQAFNARIELSELFVKYQDAYLENLEWEKWGGKNSLGMSKGEVREMCRLSFSRELNNEKEKNIKKSCIDCKKDDHPCRMWKVSEEEYYCYPCWHNSK